MKLFYVSFFDESDGKSYSSHYRANSHEDARQQAVCDESMPETCVIDYIQAVS